MPSRCCTVGWVRVAGATLGGFQTHRRAAQRRDAQRRAQPPLPPAARVTDLHTCPMQTPAGPVPIPQVGGPFVGPGCPTVLIGSLPAAAVGDSTAHGGTIAVGLPTVMMGG